MRANNSHSGVSMRLLLLNNNPAVSRLIKLSADKAGYELDEFDDYGLVPLVNYDVVMVDNELYDEEALQGLCEHTGCNYVISICQRGAQKPESANVVLEKPFLPTDFLLLLDKVKNVLSSLKSEDEIDGNDDATSQDALLEDTVAFDIDQIDTLDGDEKNEIPLGNAAPKEDEEGSNENDVDDLSLASLNFEDLSLDDDDLLDMPKEELTAQSNGEDLDVNETLDEPLEKAQEEDFNFDEEPEEKLLENDETQEALDEEVLHTPCVLDKDDINEVKQLLDDNDVEEEREEQEEIVEMAARANEDDDKEFFFNEVPDENDEIDSLELPSFEDSLLLGDDEKEDEQEDALDLPSLEESLLDEDKSLDLSLESEDINVAGTTEADVQEDMIDAFEDILNEKPSEDDEDEDLSFGDDDLLIPQVDVAMELPAVEEEMTIPQVDVAASKILSDTSIDSLDDLNENLLKSAFGEEVEEECIDVAPTSLEKKQNEEIEVIRGEIESSVARSISGLAQSDILRDALKGMRINISITFDDKE